MSNITKLSQNFPKGEFFSMRINERYIVIHNVYMHVYNQIHNDVEIKKGNMMFRTMVKRSCLFLNDCNIVKIVT